MKYGMRFGFSVLAVLLSGCVSYEYEGKEGAVPKETVQVYSSADAIRKPYTVLGKATVSGNSERISRDRLVNKLVKEAGAKGADAILIVEQQVVPDGEYSSSNRRYVNDDHEESNMQEIVRDMDTTYGNARNRSQTETLIVSYRRIIRAEYLQFTPTERKTDPAEKESSPAKDAPAAKDASAEPKK